VTTTPAAAARRRGRPRSAEADEAILDATLDLFADLGFDGLSVEAVATSAGVGKATIYRRFPSKVDLVMAACTRVTQQVTPAADTGSLRGDIEALVARLVHLLTGTVAGRVVPQMISEAVRRPDLRRAHRAFIAERRRAMIDAVRRAVARGEVATDADAELAADLVAGPVFYRHLVSGGPLDERFTTALVEAVMRAVGPSPSHRGAHP
jgi:AcrR family transcriptional regulator